MSAVTVTPDPAHPAGHALVRVAGAAEHVTTPGFRLQRDAGWGDDKLGPGGWQSSDALLQPSSAERDGADLLLHVGWNVCHHLEAGVYELSVPAAGVEPTGVFWPEIVPLHAGSVPLPPPPRKSAPAPVEADATVRVTPAPPPQPAAPTQPAAPPQAETPGPPPPVPGVFSGGGGAAVLGGGGLLVLLLLAAGGAYYTLGGPADPVPPPSIPVAPPAVAPFPPPPEPVPAPPASTALGSLSVADVIAKAPNPTAIRAEGEQRLSGDRKDDGLLLLEVAAERGDPAAAAVLARLYDPVAFQPGGPIPRPDARQAARYYRDAARGGADVAAAREALRQMLQTQAGGGNMGADLMLKDFWP